MHAIDRRAADLPRLDDKTATAISDVGGAEDPGSGDRRAGGVIVYRGYLDLQNAMLCVPDLNATMAPGGRSKSASCWRNMFPGRL